MAIQIVPTNDVDYDDDGNDDDYSLNSVNFQARTSRLCMAIDLDSIYR